MALQLTYTIPSTTISVTNAYHRISSVHVINGTSVLIEVMSYKDSVDRDSDLFILGSKRYFPVQSTDAIYSTTFSETALKVTDKSLIIRAYEYLKTLPEFSGATDV